MDRRVLLRWGEVVERRAEFKAPEVDPDFLDRLVQVFTGRDPCWMWVERGYGWALWLETDGEGRQWLCQGVDWSSGALVSERECEAPSEGRTLRLFPLVG